MMQIWDKAFKNELSKTCGTQPLNKFEEMWSASADHTPSHF